MYPNIFQRFKAHWQEGRGYVKAHHCIACVHFHPGLGSSGFCDAHTGCILSYMCDCFDSCENDFKPARSAFSDFIETIKLEYDLFKFSRR